jgi:DNA primase
MGRIPDSFIDELLARTDIVEVIEARVPLKRAGREFQARCPFHDERTPSFTVSPTKQFYHCFGCGAHGSAIKFLMDYDRLEFLDAVEELAQRAGMTVPRATRPAPTGEFDEMLAALDAAARFFQRQLESSDKARAYLERRGVDAVSVRRFGIGYAADAWEALKAALGSDERRLRVLDKAGLLSKNEQGRVYDKFRDRIMFPIRDRRGRVIAFGGRVLEKDDGPKYLNSPETPLFHKGRELYALYEARQANAKLARLIVVEGYMDVVSLFQYGLTQAVATLGTATTKDHAELLFRNAADVYFCFDGDRAGRAAAWRAVESVLPRMRDGRQALFLFLPDGEDPDTLVRQEGLAGFEQRLREATPLSEFFFAQQEADTDLRSADGRARLAERCKAYLAQIPDGAFRDQMNDMLIERVSIKWSLDASLPAAIREKAIEMLDEKVAAARREAAAVRAAPAAARAHGRAAPPPRRSLVRSAIALLLQQPSLVQAMQPPYRFPELRQPGIALLMELIEICRARPEIGTAALLQHFEGREEAAALHKLALMDFAPTPEHWQAEFLDALAQLDRQTVQQRIDELLARQAEGTLSDAEKAELRDCLAVKARRA